MMSSTVTLISDPSASNPTDTDNITQSTSIINPAPSVTSTINTISQSMDLSICQTTHCQCFGKGINKCSHLQRMLRAIKYYKLLDSTQTTSDINEILVSFYFDIYKELINDYQHIISTHCQQHEAIYDEIISNKEYGACDYEKCKCLNRYYNPMRATVNSPSIDYKALFFSELLDSAHHWIYHLYDCGMRVRKGVITENKTEKDDEDDIQHIDKEFGRIKKEIKTRREAINVNLNRFTHGNNKYKINVNNNDNNTSKSVQDGITSIDSLFHHLDKDNVKNESMDKLHDLVKIENYDTDALGDDVIDSDDIYQQQSNVLNTISNDDNCTKIVISFLEELLSMFLLYTYYIYHCTLFLTIFILSINK